jgi:hypothetical protein
MVIATGRIEAMNFPNGEVRPRPRVGLERPELPAA